MADADMVEWIVDSMIHADGFWNPSTVGSSIRGILVLQRLADDNGQKILNPFYVMELTADAKTDIFVEQKLAPAGLAKGKYVGFNCWKRLQGITRRMGHEFEFTFLGRSRLPSGKKLVNIRIRCSPKMVREIERMSPAVLNAGDEEG